MELIPAQPVVEYMATQSGRAVAGCRCARAPLRACSAHFDPQAWRE